MLIVIAGAGLAMAVTMFVGSAAVGLTGVLLARARRVAQTRQPNSAKLSP